MQDPPVSSQGLPQLFLWQKSHSGASSKTVLEKVAIAQN